MLVIIIVMGVIYVYIFVQVFYLCLYICIGYSMNFYDDKQLLRGVNQFRFRIKVDGREKQFWELENKINKDFNVIRNIWFVFFLVQIFMYCFVRNVRGKLQIFVG